ncbi:T9SS type A sorting domain-containing protein [Hymenobacter algoricola]|uniref:T9SS type A sorting domain-containing protein n=1 Tax=Hymenobacter algoricola TaxID=486267 RepID=A0ABP7MKN6_9BACT
MKNPIAATLLSALLLTPMMGWSQSYLQQTFEPGANQNPVGTRTQLVYTATGATANARPYSGTLFQATSANNANVAPVTANVFSEGTSGYGVVNNQGGGTETATLTFDEVIFPVTSGNYLTFRLASFATNNNGGIDNSAVNGVFVRVAYNGSATFTSTLQVRGLNNGSVFDFNATGTAQPAGAVNAPPATATVVTSPNDLIGNTKAVPPNGIGYSNVRINFGPAITSVQIQIFLSADAKTAIFIDDVRVGSGGPLPVELTTFEAMRQRGAVLLNWATASEKNNDHFDVQRSSDGHEFKTIGTVRGQGNATKVSAYTFTDQEALAGLRYYRLRQVDTDGTFSFSPVRAVADDNAVLAYPSPTYDRLNLPMSAVGQPYQVLSSLGQRVLQGSVPANGVVEVVKLPAGSYILKVGTGRGQLVQRFLRRD